MVKRLSAKGILRRRRAAIKAVIKACLPDFLNHVFLRMLGLMTVEEPLKAIEYPALVHLGSCIE